MDMPKRSRQLKSVLHFESEADREIRTDIEGRILKNTARVVEYKSR